MKYHHVCTQCGNTVPEEQTNIVITDIMSDNRNKQVYCPECFKSLTKDIIATNKKHSTKNNKKQDLDDIEKSCCGH